MQRIEKVLEALGMLYEEKKQGITAEEIAYRLQSDRSNISRDLNRLHKEQRCYKEKTRPVRFFPCTRKRVPKTGVPKETPKMVDMDKFLKRNPSLFHQIEQGKAAILYPGDGMHMLLLGETGVGKSLFADLLHKYGIQSGKLAEASPFIQFNCADYAHNPQLLMSQLFGHVKGAYTGVETNKTGLLEKAPTPGRRPTRRDFWRRRTAGFCFWMKSTGYRSKDRRCCSPISTAVFSGGSANPKKIIMPMS